jgi:hypothetical protein
MTGQDISMPVPYPVRVDAGLDGRLSRWLWLVKWVLVIPHYIVLAFLWVVFVVFSVVAFFAIAFTGRFPLALFDFNVGVLRWTWRVNYYAYSALGTDRYPPFTLADVPDYPARLHVPYPARLSRGLVWVKWWLLAIPHYLVVGVFVGGGIWLGWQLDKSEAAWLGGGLIGLLVLFAAVVLLFRGRYPQSIFDLVLGMNRWTLRVTAYSALMTDVYPPFRLDMGGADPGTLHASGHAPETPGSTYAGQPPGPPFAPGQRARTDWTAGRVVAVVFGVLFMLASFGLLGGAGLALVADQVVRDDDGFVTTPDQDLFTSSHALVSDRVDLQSADGPDALYADRLVGDVRLRVWSQDPAADIFIGVASTTDVGAYLSGVEHVVLEDISDGDAIYSAQAGSQPPQPPADQDFWVTSAHGTGTQSVIWEPEDGDWTIVVMNTAGTAGLDVEADVGVTLPVLDTLVWVLAIPGVVLLVAGVALVYAGASGVGKRTTGPPRSQLPPPQGQPPPTIPPAQVLPPPWQPAERGWQSPLPPRQQSPPPPPPQQQSPPPPPPRQESPPGPPPRQESPPGPPPQQESPPAP